MEAILHLENLNNVRDVLLFAEKYALQNSELVKYKINTLLEEDRKKVRPFFSKTIWFYIKQSAKKKKII